MSTRKLKSRFTAALLTVLVLVEMLPVFPILQAAERSVVVQTSGEISFSEAELPASIPYTQSLSDKDGQYIWTMTIDPRSALADQSVRRTVSQDGSFTAQITGDYLIEIWGGKGGDGSNSEVAPGGDGGSAGYVYGIIHLDVGDSIVYTIGGNGSYTLLPGDGGANGGAGHGNVGIYFVGGGGGYSAVYLYRQGETVPSEMDDADRTSRLLMIAGGGGGGGAGGTLSDSYTRMQPDGGNAGTINSNAVVIDGFGICYGAENGKSSSTSTKYVGKGGSTYPGAAVTTSGGDYRSKAGQDWSSGGNGGNGNIRGGAGGAGYCGGSGGIASSILSQNSVGGGGGGSSFVSINVDPADTSAQEYLLGSNPGTAGGAISIVNLSATQTNNLRYLSDVTVSGLISDYFDVELQTNFGTPSVENGQWSVSHIPLLTESNATNITTIKMIFTPKEDFSGGNDVPLLLDDAVEIKYTDTEEHTIRLAISDERRFVNVKIPLTAVGNVCEYDKTVDTPESVPGTDLYTETDLYLDTRENAGTGMSAFIESVGDYKINGAIPSNSYSPSVSTGYTVSFTITPKPGNKAVIGPYQETHDCVANAAITVKDNNTAIQNSNEMHYSKTLSENGGVYTLSFAFRGIIQYPQSEGKYVYSKQGGQTFTSDGTYAAPFTGYYLVQAWGAKGGDGGDAIKTSSGITQAGGVGAAGGYAYNIVYLEEGQRFSSTVGAAGEDAADKSTGTDSWLGTYYASSGGAGGQASYVKIIDGNNANQVVVIGGGGGGGGGSVIGTTDGSRQSGGNAVRPTGMTTVNGITAVSNADGANGTQAYWIIVPLAGNAGTSGTNQTNSKVGTTQAYGHISDESRAILDGAANASSGTDSGKVVITPLDTMEYVQEINVQPYDSFVIPFSQYFTVSKIAYNGLDSVGSVSAVGNTTTINNLVPHTSSELLGESVEFSIIIDLVPKEGFLGGNDVPLLIGNAVLKQADSNNDKSDDDLTVAANDATDYANVALAVPDITIETTDVEYVLGFGTLSWLDLCEYSGITISESWMDDYVVIAEPSAASVTNLTPEEDVNVSFEFSMIPLVLSPEKAMVITEATPYSLSKSAHVDVKTSVVFDLTGLHVDADLDEQGRVVLERSGFDYTAIVTPIGDKLLPDGAQFFLKVITGEGEDITNQCSYESVSGEITIPGGILMEHSVIVKAEAEVVEIQTHTVHYIWQTAPDDTTGNSWDDTVKYAEGADVEDYRETYKPEAVPGYTFAWEGFESEMPGNDMFVIGTYSPIQYTITITYVGAGNATPEPYSKDVFYGESYSVASPAVNGYKTDVLVVAGTVTGNVSVTVTYTESRHMLTIYYLYDDNTTAAKTVEAVLDENESFSYNSPSITGYTPDVTTVSGTMTETGVTRTVRYYGNHLNVTLKDGTDVVESRTVQYGKILGYTVDNNNELTYQTLPTLSKAGYKFLGWMMNGVKVDEETVVSANTNMTLQANWEALSFVVTIYHRDTNGVQLADPVQKSGTVGTEYNYTAPEIEGYTPVNEAVSGSIMAANQSVIVIYGQNTYTLTILYVNYDTDEAMSGMTAHTESVLFKDAYSVTSPDIPSGFDAVSQSVVSGTMPSHDITVTVYYYEIVPVINVEVSWDSLDYTYRPGEWNPLTHNYDGRGINPDCGHDPIIQITNTQLSNVTVTADLACIMKNAFSSLNINFSDNNFTLAPKQSAQAAVSLTGVMPDGIVNGRTYTIGTITVSISGGTK